MPFTVELDTLLVKKVVLRMLFLLILQKSKLIRMIHSAFNKDKNNYYYYNTFLEKFSYK